MINNIKRGGMVAAVLLGCLGLAVSAQGASFDCGKAGTKVEHIICDNPEISKLDDELSVAYKAALKDEMQPDSIKQAQKLWMKVRNGCADAVCVKQAYEEQLRGLSSHITADEAPTFEFSLVKDTGLEVCRDYVKNLKMVKPTETSLACEVTLSPSIKQFGFPKWEELDIKDYWDIMYEIERVTGYYFYYNKTATKDDWRKDYEKKTKSGEIKPRLRRTKIRLSADSPELTVFGYTKRSDNIEFCKKNVAEGKSQGIYTGEMVFIFDKGRNALAEIGNSDPNLRETESMFGGRQEHFDITHNSTLYFLESIPAAEGYKVVIYGIDMPFFPKSPDIDIYYYSGRQFCEITARRITNTKR